MRKKPLRGSAKKRTQKNKLRGKKAALKKSSLNKKKQTGLGSKKASQNLKDKRNKKVNPLKKKTPVKPIDPKDKK